MTGMPEHGDAWPHPDLPAVLAAIAGRAAEHDRDGSFPFEAFDALFPTGALRLTIPSEHGGLGRGLAAATDLVVDVGAADPSVALVLAQHSLFHAGLGESGWPDAPLALVRKSALEGVALINALRVEPDLGTPARGGLPATVAERLPGGAGWRLTGRKIYSTGIPLLRWMLVYVRTDDPEPLVGNVLVEAGTPGYTIERTWDPLGMRATRSDDVVFDGAIVPFDHALGFTATPPPPTAITIAWNCVLMAAVYHGVARAARDWVARYLTERTPANLGAPLSSLPRFQEAMGRIDATVTRRRPVAAHDGRRVRRRRPGVRAAVDGRQAHRGERRHRRRHGGRAPHRQPRPAAHEPARAAPARRPPRAHPHTAGRHHPRRRRHRRVPRRDRPLNAQLSFGSGPIGPHSEGQFGGSRRRGC